MARINHNHYMTIAQIVAAASYCDRLKVGAVIVTKEGIVIPGYNGSPPGADNCCEDDDGNTLPNVLHAERNAFYKFKESNLPVESLEGATMYITHSPCERCAELILFFGIQEVYFNEVYRNRKGIVRLREQGIKVMLLDF